MKIFFTLLAVLTLAACMGPAGNPNGQPYGDSIAVKPEPAPPVAYDPHAMEPSRGDQPAR